uniref:SET domain-containing protein n=1 Tax=Globisporangium ultimum (strain ATCC 200006 / CBS 805.95 / DAOM BR144) TaxID=431595 RepID=K3W6Z4_GLOUD
MVNVFRRFQLMLAGTTAARRFQEEADVGVAAVLSCYRGLRSQTTNADKDNGELFEEAVAIIQKKKFEQQKAYVQDQLQTAFDAILKLPRGPETSTPTISLSGFERIDDASSDKQRAGNTLESLLGYSLRVETSSIPNAGEGVKVKGKVPIGSLVALFPGIVYVPEHFKKPQYLQEISNNPYARARFDSVVIDAKRESSTPRNPLAVAHKINHPPAGSKPNVIPFSFDFPPEQPFTQAEYEKLIPNSFVEMPSRWSMFGKRALVHGLAFIATADIEDEELFLNYRYNPHNPLPEWYTPVDLESDQGMWK